MGNKILHWSCCHCAAQVMGFRKWPVRAAWTDGHFAAAQLLHKRRNSEIVSKLNHAYCFSLFLHFICLIFVIFCFFSLVSICPFSVLLTPLLLFSPLCLSTSHSVLCRSVPAQSHDSASLPLFGLSMLTFSSLLLPCALSFSSIPPSTFCLAFLFSLLYCPLYFSPSVLSSSSSLLHHKVDGWMIHLSLCPRTVVILILLHS